MAFSLLGESGQGHEASSGKQLADDELTLFVISGRGRAQMDEL